MNTILYSDNFRTALHTPLAREHEQALRCALHALMFELLQYPNRKQDPTLQQVLLQCRLRLRTLQMLVDSTRDEHELALQHCDVRSLLEDLCAAADLLLRPHGRNVIFSAAPERMVLACAPHELCRLMLELLANALLHTHGAEITVTLRRASHAISVNVQSTGNIDLNQLHQHAQRPGSGTSAMLCTARLHRGTLLWLQRNEKSVASLKLPTDLANSEHAPQALFDAPDLVDLLADQCSALYIGLAQVI